MTIVFQHSLMCDCPIETDQHFLEESAVPSMQPDVLLDFLEDKLTRVEFRCVWGKEDQCYAHASQYLLKQICDSTRVVDSRVVQH